ncbi:MAG: ATP-binding protein, partial [Geminicoccaceae bacterium]
VPAIAPPFLAEEPPVTDEMEPVEPAALDPVDDMPEQVAEPEIVEEEFDPIEDVAVTIGRIVSIRGAVVWGALFDDIDGQAARAARMGALVSMRGPESRVFGIVNRLEREQQMGNTQSERTIFEVQVLGEIADDRAGFQRGVSSYPPLDAPVTTITIRDIATIYARPRCSNVHIGQLRHNPKVPAFVLTDSLLGKHFAILGTTGTGKSCATTVILRSILDEHPQGHVVLIDPHNEYGPAFADRAELLNPRNLQLPYWLLNFEEIAHVVLHGASREQMHSQGALLKNAIILAKTQFAGGDQETSQITVDTPVPYRLSDLVSILKEGMGTFNKADGAPLYLSLINRIESLRADKRFAFMFSSISVRDNMEQVLAQLLRIPTHGKPMTIIDISGLPSDVVDVVVSVLFRLTFELAVWSERGKAPPVLLVCEEAHRYVPEESDVGFAPTKRVIAQIAKEGRKYGVTLCLVSQRPSELAVSSLAQCNTIFALRMSNEHDQAFVSQSLSENARWLVDSLPSLNTQEAVVVGDGVTVPVHIRFKNLLPQHRPASHDPSFSENWRREADANFLASAIDRWRRQAR